MAGLERCATPLLLVAALTGCGGALTVRAEVVQPAQVPVRAFPRILVTAASDVESRDLASTVATHLSRGRSSVDRMEREAVDGLRTQGRIERATVVLEVTAILTQSQRAEWGPRDGVDCGPVGCLDSRRTTIQDVPVVQVHVLVRVAEGPSGRSLQRVELSEEESGADVLGMRLRVLERVSTRVLALLDQRSEQVAVDLYPLEHPEVQEALAEVRDGRWPDARRRLEAFVRTRGFQALPREHRALVLYDLGQTRRFDTSMPVEDRFERAERALRAAVRLVPQPLYARAITELEAHRRNRAMVREQQDAMAHNFALSAPRDAARVPEPPARYRD